MNEPGFAIAAEFQVHESESSRDMSRCRTKKRPVFRTPEDFM